MTYTLETPKGPIAFNDLSEIYALVLNNFPVSTAEAKTFEDHARRELQEHDWCIAFWPTITVRKVLGSGDLPA